MPQNLVQQPYFTEYIQIFGYLYAQLQINELQIPQTLRLLSLEEMIANVKHNKFQTQIIKDLLKVILYRLCQIQNGKKVFTNSCLQFMKGKFERFKESLIEKYFAPLIIQQYIYNVSEEQNDDLKDKQECATSFYKFSQGKKLKILTTAIQRIQNSINISNKQTNSKEKKESTNDENVKKTPKSVKGKVVSIPSILCLGNDKKNLYFYMKFLPAVVLQYKQKRWNKLFYPQVETKIRSLVKSEQTYENYFLLKNLTRVYEQIMLKQESNIKPTIRIHKIKQSAINNHDEQNVSILKDILLDIQLRYCKYLSSIKNVYFYGTKSTRNKYVQGVKVAKSIGEMIKGFYTFQNSIKQGVYQFKGQTIQKEYKWQEIIWKSQNKQIQDYKILTKLFWANILTREIHLDPYCSIKISNFVQYFLPNNESLNELAFQILVHLLNSAMGMLQIKQQNYLKKMQKRKKKMVQQSKIQSDILENNKSFRYSRSSSVSSAESLPNSSQTKVNNQGMQLRNKKANKFGIKTIDSDEQSEYKAGKSMKTRSRPAV